MTIKDSTLRLDKELGIIEKMVPTTMPKIIPNTIEVSEDDIEDDYKYQRDNIYNHPLYHPLLLAQSCND